MLYVIDDCFYIRIGPLCHVWISGDFWLKISNQNCLHLNCQECYSLFYVQSIMTHGVIYNLYTKKLGLNFCFLCFVGFIIKCIYDTLILCLHYIASWQALYPVGSVSDLVWIDIMHNKWMNVVENIINLRPCRIESVWLLRMTLIVLCLV
jgi:hypothetical protein